MCNAWARPMGAAAVAARGGMVLRHALRSSERSVI
jgi:hypothetical protein